MKNQDDEINDKVGSVVEWLKRRDRDRHSLGSKHTRAILLCPWESIYSCLVIFASSSNLKSYLYSISTGEQYLGISESRSG